MGKIKRSRFDFELPIMEQAVRSLERGEKEEEVEAKFGHAVMKKAREWLV